MMQRLEATGRTIHKQILESMPFFSRKKTDLRKRGASINLVKIDGTLIQVEVVTTKPAIDRGLSGRKELGSSEGMLFMFDHSALFRFWMRKMLFPIDIVWISADMQIVDITKNLDPLPDEAEAVFYSPTVPAMYVLEVNANFCDLHAVRLGDHVEFLSA